MAVSRMILSNDIANNNDTTDGGVDTEIIERVVLCTVKPCMQCE